MVYLLYIKENFNLQAVLSAGKFCIYYFWLHKFLLSARKTIHLTFKSNYTNYSLMMNNKKFSIFINHNNLNVAKVFFFFSFYLHDD